MTARVPENDKKPGLSYAFTDDGIELPVVDVGHPAFALDPGEAELARLRERSVEATLRWGRMPGVLRWLLTRTLLRRGALTRGLVASRGTFLSGAATYLFKLGPENLGRGYARRIDRVVAATLPSVSVRLRLQHLARLLADALAPRLEQAVGRPLVMVNLGGGPAADSFNAVMLLHRRHPRLLDGRRIRIRVLDLDAAGPSFGRRAVQALRAPGAPLAGLDVALEHVRYDWRAWNQLGEALGENVGEAVFGCSSEGALFEYGTDEEIVANLEELRARLPQGSVMAGSVARADSGLRALHDGVGAALHPRALDAFAALAGRAGWRVARTIDAPLTHDVLLEVEPPPSAR